MCKLVDLTIADDISYVELNATLEKYVQTQTKKRKKIIKDISFISKRKEFSEDIKFIIIFTILGILPSLF